MCDLAAMTPFQPIRPDNEPQAELACVGKIWQSPYGQRRIMQIRNGKCAIRTAGVSEIEIVAIGDIRSVIQRDKAAMNKARDGL